MPSLVLKSIPRALHTRLRQEALRNRRSMTQESIHILEQSLCIGAAEFPLPAKGRRPLTQKMLDRALDTGRA
jgi:plasmid stability protein